MLCQLKHALHSKNINLKYQPIYTASSREIVGFEALLRWNDPLLGRVCPETLVRLATQHDLMTTLSLYVIKKAIAEMATFVLQHNVLLSLNISPADLISASFKKTLLAEIERYQLPASSIMLEITEVSCLDTLALSQNAAQLKRHGFHLALDDFGKGCSNADRLRSLPVTDVKIDKTLTHAICANGAGAEMTLNKCKSLYQRPYTLIFEGIEFEEQLSCIRQQFPRACAQGWYFSPAVCLDGVRSLLNLTSIA